MSTEVTAPSCIDLAGDLVGAVRSSRTDLATNRQLLDEAMLQDARRAADRGGVRLQPGE